MANKRDITPEVLRQTLHYDPRAGRLFWLPREERGRGDKIFNRLYAGKEAFTYRMGEKHLQGQVYGRPFLAHRVVWAIVHGEWPRGEIDHINGNPVDNRIANLRDIPKAHNQRNMKRFKSNTSGVSGVDWQASRSMWRVRVSTEGKTIHIGRFRDFGDAVKARKAAEARYNFHPNHGRA